MKKLSTVKITRFFNYLKQISPDFLDKVLVSTKENSNSSIETRDSCALHRYQQAYRSMKREFTKNTSIIIQGPIYDSEFVAKNYRYYTDLGYQVVVSTWDSNGKWQEALLPDDVLVYSESMEFRNRVLEDRYPLESAEKGEDVYHPSRNYYQALSTVNGFKLISKEGNVIKMRSDEFYSNLDEIEFQLNKNLGTRLICGDTFAVPGKQISDHLIATTGKALHDTFNSIVSKYKLRALLTKRFTSDPYGDGYTAEQEVLEAFLYSTGVPRDNTDIEIIFDSYCKIVNREDLGDYIIKATTQKKKWTNIK